MKYMKMISVCEQTQQVVHVNRYLNDERVYFWFLSVLNEDERRVRILEGWMTRMKITMIG